jgi:hypothetical protein
MRKHGFEIYLAIVVTLFVALVLVASFWSK